MIKLTDTLILIVIMLGLSYAVGCGVKKDYLKDIDAQELEYYIGTRKFHNCRIRAYIVEKAYKGA